MLTGHVLDIVGEGIAGINFYEIVNQHHLKDAQYVERLMIGVLREDDNHEREVPGMFGTVFSPATMDDNGLTKDFLEAVNFDNKSNLAAESFGGGVHGWR